jgi:hypothetical protein
LISRGPGPYQDSQPGPGLCLSACSPERPAMADVGLVRGAVSLCLTQAPVPLAMLFYRGPGFLEVLALRPIL